MNFLTWKSVYLLQGYITAQFGSFNCCTFQIKKVKTEKQDIKKCYLTKFKEMSIISKVTLFQARTISCQSTLQILV